jgi:hypothetical protein
MAVLVWHRLARGANTPSGGAAGVRLLTILAGSSRTDFAVADTQEILRIRGPTLLVRDVDVQQTPLAA